KADSDDPVRLQRFRLRLHPADGERPGRVHRLTEDVQFHVLAILRNLETDVIDRTTEDEAEWFDTNLLQANEFVHGEIAREEARSQPLGRGGRDHVRWLLLYHCFPTPSITDTSAVRARPPKGPVPARSGRDP